MRRPNTRRVIALSGVLLSASACSHVVLPNTARDRAAPAPSENYVRVDHVVGRGLPPATVELREVGQGLPAPASRRWVLRSAGTCAGLGSRNGECLQFQEELARALLERGLQVLTEESYQSELAALSADTLSQSHRHVDPSLPPPAPPLPTVDGILLVETVHERLGEREDRAASLHYFEADAQGNARGTAHLTNGTQTQLSELVHMRAGRPSCIQRARVEVQISAASPAGQDFSRWSAALAAPAPDEEVSSFLFRLRGDAAEPTLPSQRPLKQTGARVERDRDRCSSIEIAARGEALASIAKSLADRVAKGGATP